MSVRRPLSVPDLEGRCGTLSSSHSQKDLLQRCQTHSPQLSPPSRIPLTADNAGSSWCPTEPSCHPRNLPRASLVREVSSQDESICLSCTNPLLSFLAVRILRARQGSDVPRGAQCCPAGDPGLQGSGPFQPCWGLSRGERRKPGAAGTACCIQRVRVLLTGAQG